LELCDGVSPPEKYISDNTDCDDTDPDIHPNVEITIYKDIDGDGYGNPLVSKTTMACAIESGFVTNGDDCDDSNANINPSAEDNTKDGIDYNCDGYDPDIWTGPNKVFSKDKNDDWTNPQYQDMITEKVTFTRQDNNYLFNLTWWKDNIGDGTPIHGQDASDLAWEFWGPPVNPVSNITGHDPTGGTKGVRWALLDTGDYPTQAWQDFQLYGTLGENTHFYSFHNIASLVLNLEEGSVPNVVYDDFQVYGTDNANLSKLVGKTLGVWLQEEDIYFTLKFTEWTPASEGGIITYERSTPN
jgi:hypothetical protein